MGEVTLRQTELVALAAEFTRELAGGVVQDVYAPTTTRVYLEVRVPGRSHLLHFCTDLQVARVSAVEKRPPNPATPPAWQSVLRRELTGAKFVGIEAHPQHRLLMFTLTKSEDTRALAFESTGTPGLALLNGKGAVLCLSIPHRKGERVGSTWQTSEAAPVLAAPSRLQSDFVHLRLAHGAEALFAGQEELNWRKAKRLGLESKLKKLERTKEKVRIDAARLDNAQDFQRDGTLLSQNLFRVERGQTSITLTEYTADGEQLERTIALDPKRSPKEEVEGRFHQYRRLVRGAQVAQQRLAALEQEASVLRAALAEIDSASFDETAVPEAAKRGRKKRDEALPPYKEYRGAGGRKIWVGRGAKHNDELTFHVAKPFHHWLHALGVPGAHVVVPLQKNESISSELLIDAAHLALHHSEMKGEPSGEVTSVPVKFVRKSGGHGAVIYTREKTIVVRVEPERLQRLLKTETQLEQ